MSRSAHDLRREPCKVEVDKALSFGLVPAGVMLVRYGLRAASLPGSKTRASARCPGCTLSSTASKSAASCPKRQVRIALKPSTAQQATTSSGTAIREPHRRVGRGAPSSERSVVNIHA